MSRAASYRLHKWIAVSAGVFFLSWIASGIVMILPTGGPDRRPLAPPDYESAVVSPARAIAAMADRPVDITLKRIGHLLVYQMQTRRGMRLVDARSGDPVSITPEIAERVVRSEYLVEAGALKVERLDSYGSGYRAGPLPVYRITPAGSASRYFVSLQDGSVRKLTPARRIRSAIESLHTFAAIPWLRGNARLQRVVLFGAAMIAMSAALTGYFIALPKRRGAREPSRGD